ncbi:tetratricopeptide repeat protein [Euryhalocaulis caribicus]|uniref:tetratricopeptide repeat protein n=1 Tax=Euryhalocaulis caribicus TaxID=1161401 RepID=UPI00039E2AFE|nr:tetratricopeptide repeat protein [Euryhalocaulis caribicus]
MKRLVLLALAASALIAAPADSAHSAQAEGQTLLGTALRDPGFPAEVQERLETDLEIARARMEIAPDREDSFIWLGRRLGYLGRYEEAVAVFSEGLEQFPESYKLRRFRGRHLARSRQFEASVADYREALALMEGVPDSFEPDGIINSRAQPLGTYRSNLHYYLAQTSFATGDFEQMNAGMQAALDTPIMCYKDDLVVPVAYWRYIALMKLGRADKAAAVVDAVPADLELIENHAYYEGLKILQGALSPEDAGSGALQRFAHAIQLVFDGQDAEAETILIDIVESSPLGFWPAEIEVLRIRDRAAASGD